MAVVDDGALIFKSFIDGYSIDGKMENIWVNMLYQPDEYEFKSNDPPKDVANLRFMMYQLNSLICNDRDLLYFVRTKKEFLKYEYDSSVATQIEKRFKVAAKFEAIHSLIKSIDLNDLKTKYS